MTCLLSLPAALVSLLAWAARARVSPLSAFAPSEVPSVASSEPRAAMEGA